jgi:hypothetical protein
MGKWHSIFPPITGRKTLDRIVWTISCLGLACCVAFASRNILVGPNGTAEGFGFGGLWIQYDIRTGGLLSESFRHIVIAQTFPENQAQGESAGVFTFTFAGRNPIEVQSAGQETVWVDPQGNVTNLGRVLRPEDIELMQTHRNEVKPPISTPEEFLAIVERLRGGEAVSSSSGKRHFEMMPRFCEIESDLACDASRGAVCEAES